MIFKTMPVDLILGVVHLINIDMCRIEFGFKLVLESLMCHCQYHSHNHNRQMSISNIFNVEDNENKVN